MSAVELCRRFRRPLSLSLAVLLLGALVVLVPPLLDADDAGYRTLGLGAAATALVALLASAALPGDALRSGFTLLSLAGLSAAVLLGVDAEGPTRVLLYAVIVPSFSGAGACFIADAEASQNRPRSRL